MTQESPRQVIDLSGVWQLSCDYHGPEQEVSESTWQDVQIPSNWHLAGLPNYHGEVWYRRQFPLPPMAVNQVAHIAFHGVDYFAEVWLNGVYVGYHEGYFQTFTFPITNIVQEENFLVVKVVSPKEAPDKWFYKKRLIKGFLNTSDCRPGAWDLERGQDGNTGGIWNKVEVWVRNATHIDEIWITPVVLSAKIARLQVTSLVESTHSHQVQAFLRICHLRDSDLTTVLEETRTVHLTRGRNVVTFIETIDSPQLWWSWDRGPQNFYTVEIHLIKDGQLLDRMVERSGIRDFRLDASGVWCLNGQRIFPRGTNLLPALWLSEYTPARIAQDIQLLKEANVNAVRLHAHVNRRELYDALDEAGIIVWQDFPLQWVYEDDDAFAEIATTQIQEMVHLLHNHPSIVIWACHNEPHGNLNTLDPVLENAVRQIDSTRVVRLASTSEEHTYPGWYYGSYREYRETPARPLVTEFGAQALPSVHLLRETFPKEKLFPPDWELWSYHCFLFHETFNVAGVEMGDTLETFVENSQAYQADLLQFAIESYRRQKYRTVTGLFQFMFVDCWPAITWSVVDYNRIPKQGYHALKRAFQPVLGSLEIREDRVSVGQRVNIGLSIVNDLPRHLSDLIWTLRVLAPDGNKLEEWSGITDVEPDSVLILGDPVRPLCFWRVPRDARTGVYAVEVELTAERGDVHSTNSTSVLVFSTFGSLREY